MNTNIQHDFYQRKLPAVAAIVLSLSFLFYLLNISYGLLMCLVFLSYLICSYKDEVAASLGIFLLANNIILTISFFVQDGVVSYLWTAQFDQYYTKVLFLENLFWGFFIVVSGSSSANTGQKSTIFRKNIFSKLSPFAFLFIGIPLLILDIVLSSSSYFISYVEFSSTGTVAFEAGAAFVAFSIFLRIGKETSKQHLFLEAFAVLLVLYIAIGSGKRLPLAYPIFAYTVWIAYRYGRFLAGSIYLTIATGGYAFGLFRDAMVLPSLSTETLISGLRSTNQGATLHASAVYVRIVDENLISTFDQLISFVSNFFLAIFVSVSTLPDVARINEYAMDYYAVQGNGGLIGAYSYFFLDWVGPFALSLILAWIYKSRGAVAALAFGFLAVMSPRWTLYNIGPALRVLGFVAAFIFLMMSFDFRRLTSRLKDSEATP